MAAEHGMEQVAELVEEGHHVAVLHETGIAGLAAGEVAHQRGLGNLHALDAVPDPKFAAWLYFPGRGWRSR